MKKKVTKPKFKPIQEAKIETIRDHWLVESKKLALEIRKNHGDEMIDVDAILEEDKQD